MIDNSQQTAARIAGVSFLLSMVIVVFANYEMMRCQVVDLVLRLLLIFGLDASRRHDLLL